jgi:hypothetical protein
MYLLSALGVISVIAGVTRLVVGGAPGAVASLRTSSALDEGGMLKKQSPSLARAS